jgi:hypothetical protein
MPNGAMGHMRIASLVVLLIVAAVASANATPFTFADSAKIWPGWSGNHNSTDSVGTPDFLGGYGSITASGALSSISFLYTQQGYAHDPNIPLKAGAFFVDANADGVWDYVVDTLGVDDTATHGAGYYNLYAVSIPEAYSSSYILSQNSQNWSCCSIREDHPVGIATKGLTPIASVGFSGWYENANTNASNPLVSTFTFSGNNLVLGANFTVSWMPTCANDVVYETIKNPNPVPEPGSLILLGTGICALGLAMRRHKK